MFEIKRGDWAAFGYIFGYTTDRYGIRTNVTPTDGTNTSVFLNKNLDRSLLERRGNTVDMIVECMIAVLTTITTTTLVITITFPKH